MSAHVSDAVAPPSTPRPLRGRLDGVRPVASHTSRPATENSPPCVSLPTARCRCGRCRVCPAGELRAWAPLELATSRSRVVPRPLRRLLFPVECWFGEQLTNQICSHHQRRLRQIGWSRALQPPSGGWAAGDPPNRPGNAVKILIDGAEALPAIAEELRQARSHVHLTGWHFSPGFALEREGELVDPS